MDSIFVFSIFFMIFFQYFALAIGSATNPMVTPTGCVCMEVLLEQILHLAGEIIHAQAMNHIYVN